MTTIPFIGDIIQCNVSDVIVLCAAFDQILYDFPETKVDSVPSQ